MIIKLTNQITILETEKELLSVSLSEQKDRLIKQSAETSELQNKLNDQTIQFNRLSEKKDSDEQIISSIALQKAKDDESMIIRLNNQIAVLQREKELTSSDQAGQNQKLALSSAENSALKEQIGSLDLKNKKISEENSLLIRQSVEMTENIKKKEQINLSEIKIEKNKKREEKEKKADQNIKYFQQLMTVMQEEQLKKIKEISAENTQIILNELSESKKETQKNLNDLKICSNSISEKLFRTE